MQPSSTLRSRTRSRITAFAVTSRPIVGSSSSNTLGRVQEARDELAAHALAERQLAHRLPEEVGELERLDEAVVPVAVDAGLHLVDLREELERVARGQVPPQLAALPEHGADAEAEGGAVLPGHEPEDARRARRRVEDAGQDLERRRLAGAIGAHERDALARLDAEGDVGDRGDRARGGGEDVPQAAEEARAAFADAIRLGEPLDLDGGLDHGRGSLPPGGAASRGGKRPGRGAQRIASCIPWRSVSKAAWSALTRASSPNVVHEIVQTLSANSRTAVAATPGSDRPPSPWP